MAKQSGIHQLRGKVGEHSYYRQTGVPSGLVRSINPGMSQRVKTSDEYANVRLNNREFGQGGRIAAMLAQYISPKYRPMVLPFSQSKMAKVLLGFIKNDTTAQWGGRNLTPSNSGDAQVAALNAVVKNNFTDFGIRITGDEENNQVIFTPSQQTIDKCRAIGAAGYVLRFIASTSWIGTYDESEKKYFKSFARGNVYDNDHDFDDLDPIEQTYTLRPAPSPDWPAFQAGRVGIIILMPYRSVNGEQYTLQEHCTYFSWVLTDGPII